MWAIIGGTGFENYEGFELIEECDTQTPFGPCSSGFKRVALDGIEVLFISRHGRHHELLPTEINYRANIFALKSHGASKVLAISAVGSLRKELEPGTLVVPNQYIDRTKSLRQHTFAGEGIVSHVSLAKPISLPLMQALESLRSSIDFPVHLGHTAVCIEGPNFSTQAESNFYRSIGADIIGMTNVPEYSLAREAGICYLPCSFVTDYDCWDDNLPHVTLDEILAVMKGNNQRAFSMAKQLIRKTVDMLPDGCPEEGLQSGLLTAEENIPADKKDWLKILMSPASSLMEDVTA